MSPTPGSNRAQEDRSEQRDVQMWIKRQHPPQTRRARSSRHLSQTNAPVPVQIKGQGEVLGLNSHGWNTFQTKGSEIFYRMPCDSMAAVNYINYGVVLVYCHLN